MHYLIGIAAVPGGGKSLLAQTLATKLFDTSIIDYDSYQTITQQPLEEIIQLMKKGANYNQLIIPQLGEDLAKLKSGKSVTEPLKKIEISPAKYLLFETPFGREHFDSGQHIDMLFWMYRSMWL